MPLMQRSPDTPIFVHETRGEDLALALKVGPRRQPVISWVSQRPDVAGSISHILAAFEDDRRDGDGKPLVSVAEDEVVLRPAFVASLDEASAAAVSLPPATPLALELKPRGRIDQDDFLIETRWVEPGGRPVRAKLDGALLTGSEGPRRTPDPIWTLHRLAQRLAQPIASTERFKALANLRAMWPEDPRAPVETDAYLGDLRVHYAAALSLKLRTLTPGRTDFDPVLFGGRALLDADEDSRALDENLDNVLTPAAQKLFAEDRFRREHSVRPVYVLRNGEYIFVDSSLRPVLDAVRKLQDRPERERRAFILNPRPVLREAIGEEVADLIGLDRVFVETEQFSARVAGVDVWRAPVLPWLTPSNKNQWLPEKFGLRIGEDYFVLPPANVEPLLKRVQDASAAGQETVSTGGLLEPLDPGGASPPEEIPVNPKVVEALERFEPFARAYAAVERGETIEPAPPDEERYPGKLFLVVRENLDEVEFAPAGSQPEEGQASSERIAAPKRLITALKPHQVDGLTWLAASVSAKRPGVLLADDMGLGKTLQAIALMAWLQEEAEAGRASKAPFLIVAPTGLLGTWRDEIVKHLHMPRLGSLIPAFGSDLKALKEEGTFGAKDIDTGRSALRAGAWRDAGVVLTTYETLRDYHFSFARTRFNLIVYDEIQKLKNPASQMTRAAKTLNGSFTLGMTGTPVENRLQDLWSIMDVLAPGLLGSSRDFERRHPADDPVALGRLKSQLTEPRDGWPQYMLRRLKSDALEGLPSKHIHTFETPMPPFQANAYRDLVMRAAAGAAGGTMGKGGMLSTLAAMRGVSLHPIDPRAAPADLDAYANESARLSKTLTLLEGIAAKNEKALVFVEDLAMQERLAGVIQVRFKLSKAPLRINGGVPGPKRQAMVESFQQDRGRFDVLILSPKAGGVGLTITSANHVIHLSRWWNPAVEDQATDRVFRIGQTRDVQVYLPLAVHPDPAIRDSSFDLKLNALIERKRQLTRDLFLSPEMDDSELSDLFREVALGGEGAGEAAPPREPIVEEASREPDPIVLAAASPPMPSKSSEDGASAIAEPVRTPDEIRAKLAPDAQATLSLPKALVASGIQRWRREAGQARPTSEILSLFAGKHIVQVTIRDPYALGHRNARNAQVEFLKLLKASARALEAVTVEYAPEVEADVDEGAARRDFGSKFVVAFPRNAPKYGLCRRQKRSRDDDFHDRFVEIDVRHAGGAIRRHELQIGRGVEALFDVSKQCTATYVPPSENEFETSARRP